MHSDSNDLNPILGTQDGKGLKNPILTLAEKHKVKTTFVRAKFCVLFVTSTKQHFSPTSTDQ